MRRFRFLVVSAVVLIAVLARNAVAQGLTDLLHQAEDARKAGRTAQAQDLFERARQGFPNDINAIRGTCETGMLLFDDGQQTSGVQEACYRAFSITHSPRDMRNQVWAMLSPAAKPTLDTIATATFIADATLRQAPDEPWGYLARCDVAKRLRRADLLEACLKDLKRIAPNDETTRLAMAFRPERAPIWIWSIRLLVILGLGITIWHAVRRNAERRRKSRPGIQAAALVAMFCVLLSGASARSEPPVIKNDQVSHFKIDDSNPEGSVPSLDAREKQPLEFGYWIQDIAAKAERASHKGDQPAAARFYRALAIATPTAFATRKLCSSLEAQGDLANAIQSCRETLTREGVEAEDSSRFVALVLAYKGPQPAEERKELDAVIKHLETQSGVGNLPAVLRCQVATRFEDRVLMESCTAELVKAAPNDPMTVSFQWALALRNHDKDAARRLVDRARELGMNKDGLAKMESATDGMAGRRSKRVAVLGGAAIAGLVGIVLMARRRFARRRAAV